MCLEFGVFRIMVQGLGFIGYEVCYLNITFFGREKDLEDEMIHHMFIGSF